MPRLTRREFLALAAGGTATLAIALAATRRSPLALLEPVDVADPLAAYPTRDWEAVYRDQYRYDSSYTFVCSPNDTHACRLRAFVRNGVVMRTEQNYDVARYADLYGNTATAAWHPRGCAKGYQVHRRVYGPFRLKYPLIRAGWRQWADDGFPPLTPELRTKYRFDARGSDELVRVSWDEARRYLARGLIAIARTYSGPEGRARLEAQGYPPEMLDAMGGAGTRTLKFRGGMGLLGVLGKYGMYRFANMMALLDADIRGVGPEEAKGGRLWSNYTWHGDQAPGMPFVTGLQGADVDFNDLRFSKLTIQVGKNLVENKMAESHFFIEVMERGGKIVTITPEYSPPATKADYWIPIRPATDAALFLGITRILIDRGWYDADFVRRFTDLPLLIRTDTGRRIRAAELFPDYQPGLSPDGPSFAKQGLTPEQYERLGGDFVVWDEARGGPAAITRDDVGDRLTAKGIRPTLDWRGRLRLVDGTEVEALTTWTAYRDHLADYDLETVVEITGSPRELVERLAHDIATIRPAAAHIGEGVNHWFHATLANRAIHLPFMLTGNIGRPGAGVYTWAGNYKSAVFQGHPESGPGFKGWIAEDPFEPNLDPNASGSEIRAHLYGYGEEPAYWNHGDRPLIVETPKYGRKVFTGRTHMPTPTKALWFTNVNLLNNAKHHYEMIKNVDPLVDLIATTDIEVTSSVEYADIALPATSWLESGRYEVTASCSNPFLQIWGRAKDGIEPLYEARDDVAILAEVAKAMGDELGDRRFEDYWRFVLDGREDVYLQRLLDASITTTGYRLSDILAGRYGEPGAALMLFRTYPRIPFYEQVHESLPFFTDTGRLNSYCDIPEALEYGENFVVHREGPEATPYLPNVIVSSNPLIRPEDYGIPEDAMGWDERTVRNIKKPWSAVKRTTNPLWAAGYRLYCLTPKTRHRVHSSWSTSDWTLLWDSNFADPYRADPRTPWVGEHQLHIHPETARELGIEDGDYVYVDANPADRPYVGWRPDDPFYRVARLMLRAKYNPAYPKGVVMMKHGPFQATERSVRAHETRPDGRALSEGTGYQANLRYGSQQSVTRDWSMPMHQTDNLFHKAKDATAFIFGYENDNHALNTVPKETLVKVIRAEPGGLGGRGRWAQATTGLTPGDENEVMRRYLAGELGPRGRR
ncbi:MAG TPA: molybdopterin-dependent oxidoreductase [Candidatus Binatia bacterium]|nr:molybdopterin-dependent oxidoreductase [Candidatus Binatia bacterium]